MNEEELIEENANYVLGMYDLSPNDQVIADMLRMKGLNNSIVEKILVRIKKPAWEKRTRQATRMIIIAFIVLLVLVGFHTRSWWALANHRGYCWHQKNTCVLLTRPKPYGYTISGSS